MWCGYQFFFGADSKVSWRPFLPGVLWSFVSLERLPSLSKTQQFHFLNFCCCCCFFKGRSIIVFSKKKKKNWLQICANYLSTHCYYGNIIVCLVRTKEANTRTHSPFSFHVFSLPAYHRIQNTSCFFIFLQRGQTPVRRITCWSVSLLACLFFLSYLILCLQKMMKFTLKYIWTCFKKTTTSRCTEFIHKTSGKRQHKKRNSTSKCKELETNIRTHQSTPCLQTTLSVCFFHCVPISKALALGADCLRFSILMNIYMLKHSN